MSEMPRESGVQRKNPCGRMFDCFARIISKKLTTTYFVKGDTLQNICNKSKSACRFGEKCSCAHRQIDEHPSRRFKKDDDKSAVGMFKKGDWDERELVTDECHDRPWKPGKKSDQKLGQNSSKRQSFDARQLD